MVKYNLCIIDDKIPAHKFNDKIEVNDTGLIDQNVLFNYIKFGETDSPADKWEDVELYNLIKCLKEKKAKDFTFSAFTNHSFYLNHIEEKIYSPDVIIFDWDMGTGERETKDILIEILDKTYCLIAVYTGADNDDEVTSILQEDSFKSFSHRLCLIKKGEEDSANTLLSKIDGMFEYFAFSYGFNFRKSFNDAINSTFSTIGKLSFDQFITVFGDKYEETNSDGTKTNKCQMSDIDFVEIMNEQIKSQLLASSTVKPIAVNETKPSDINSEKLIWHLRMLHSPQDNIVRKGDIVFHSEKEKYYLILSSDCHLSKFWSKNLGYLTMVPLYKEDDATFLSKLKEYINSSSLKNFRITSLTNLQCVTNIAIIPCLDKVSDYILSPKEIESIPISLHAGHEQLLYEDIPVFQATGRYRLNEPFLSSLIEFILRNITDIGTPDYSEQISNSLKETIRNLGRS